MSNGPNGWEILTSHTQGHETILTGEVPDQAALYGLMTKLRELGVKILSLRFAEQTSQES
jgi:hypothetical protein